MNQRALNLFNFKYFLDEKLLGANSVWAESLDNAATKLHAHLRLQNYSYNRVEVVPNELNGIHVYNEAGASLFVYHNTVYNCYMIAQAAEPSCINVLKLLYLFQHKGKFYVAMPPFETMDLASLHSYESFTGALNSIRPITEKGEIINA